MFSRGWIVVACLLCTYTAAGQTKLPESAAKPIVLQKDEGEVRTRDPRQGVALASSEFIVKVSPKANGSKHLFAGTEELLPGAIIPKHKHHGEEEILVIQAGRAHVWLGDKEYDAEPGAIVFIPAETWISLKNTGSENINLFFVFNEPGFEEMMRCASVPKGQQTRTVTREEVKECYHHGDAELDTMQLPAKP